MSNMQEIDSILDVGVLPESAVAREALVVAWNVVTRLLEATGDSLAKICSSLVAAKSKKGLRETLRRFNSIIRMFTDTVPAGTEEMLVLETSLATITNVMRSTILVVRPVLTAPGHGP